MQRSGWVFGLSASVLLACAEGTSDRPEYTTGIDAPEQEVSTLDDRQLETVCESYDVYVETYVDFDTIAYVACLPPALVLSGSQDECERRLDACMGLFPDPISIGATLQSQELCVRDLQECNATVAELEGCVNVNLDGFLDISDWSCALFGDAEAVASARKSMDSVRVCSELNDACNRFAKVRGPE